MVRRSHAIAGAVVGLALLAAAEPRLVLPGAIAATALAVAWPRHGAGPVAPRVALVAAAWLVAMRVLAGAVGAGEPPGDGPEAWLGEAGRAEVERAALVDSVTRRAGGRQSALLRLSGDTLVYARLPRFPEVSPGDRVAVEGRWEPLPEAPAPEEEGWVAYLRRVGASGTLTASALRREAPGEDAAARLAQLRGGAADLLATVLPEPHAGLAAAIVVGLRARVDPDLARDFTAAGISHVVAISGCHFAIVVGVCAALTRGLARRPRAIVVGAVIVGYALVAGASPSVVRAALMAGIALVAREGGRRAGASRALALTVALMLLLEPRLIVEPGFQLSAVATAGLVTWSAPLGERLERAVPWLPGSIRESLAVSLAAQAATLPVVLLDFGRLSLVAPASNLLVAPLVPLVMAGAALALPLGAVLAVGAPPALASVPVAVAWLPLAALVSVARTAASVPFASVELPPTMAAPLAAVAALALLTVARGLAARGPRAAARPRAP